MCFCNGTTEYLPPARIPTRSAYARRTTTTKVSRQKSYRSVALPLPADPPYPTTTRRSYVDAQGRRSYNRYYRSSATSLPPPQSMVQVETEERGARCWPAEIGQPRQSVHLMVERRPGGRESAGWRREERRVVYV